jgi:hypothetical protein
MIFFLRSKTTHIAIHLWLKGLDVFEIWGLGALVKLLKAPFIIIDDDDDDV